MQRMLIERIENRILLGIITFVGSMILVGWVAINENARMASFEQQFLARSVERGAELFASNCSSCHGPDARGINGRAPGLNSPHLFGFNYFAEFEAEIELLQREETALDAERLELAGQLGDANEARAAQIRERLDEIAVRASEIPDEIAAAEEQIAAIEQQLQPATINGYPLDIPARLDQANWEGTLESYIFTTLVHGRPQNAEMWGGQLMSPWSQQAGGPLRDDQIQDITNYILNFDRGSGWNIEDALAVDQYARVPGVTGAAASDIEPVGYDVDAPGVLAFWEENGIVGDPVRGEAIYNSAELAEPGGITLGCSGCHGGGVAGPATSETWANINNERLTLDQFAGYTPEQYIVESILLPGAYVVPPHASGAMPANFPDRVSYQDLADIVEYLHSYDPDYVAPEAPPPMDDGGGDDGGGEENTDSANAGIGS